MKMMSPRVQSFLLVILFLHLYFVHLSYAFVGTVASYSAPYLPTTCYGSDQSEFPENRLFAAAGEAIWNNGAACGTQYQVTCISAPPPSKCLPGIIQVTVVDRAATVKSRTSSGGAALVLSSGAYSQLVSPASAKFINVSYRQVS